MKSEITNKSFGNIKAVNDLSFDVAEGEYFAFLGVNGAGKSTTINIICGQLSYDSGSVIIDADNLNSNSQSIKCSWYCFWRIQYLILKH